MAKIEYSAGGIVYRYNGKKIQFLFILDPYGKWAFPKGHIEEGEKTGDAALREVSEETGINISDINIVTEIGATDFRFSQEGKKIHKFLKLYLIKARHDVLIKPQAAEKIKKVKWVDIDKSLEFFDYENGKEALTRAIDYLKRHHGI